VDIKRSLPLLSDSKRFEKLKYVFTLGGEAVFLTESVRAYYDILMKYEGAPYKQGASSQIVLSSRVINR